MTGSALPCRRRFVLVGVRGGLAAAAVADVAVGAAAAAGRGRVACVRPAGHLVGVAPLLRAGHTANRRQDRAQVLRLQPAPDGLRLRLVPLGRHRVRLPWNRLTQRVRV